MRVAQKHMDHLVEHGYAVVPGFLSRREVAAGRAEVLRYFPAARELAAAPMRYEGMMEQSAHLQVEFPFIGDALNHAATHPRVVEMVERLLGSTEVLLSQAAIWAKYAGGEVYGQSLHVDFEGNTLVVPRDDADYRQVNVILYYTDVTRDMGPTYVVPLRYTRDVPLWPPHRPREKYPALYRHEKPILAPAGSALLFGMGTFHRASEITAPLGARFTQHLVYRAARHPFAGHHIWSHFGERPELQHFLERATPRQREVVGFPAPGDAYWTARTLRGVAQRYPGMDMKPYLRAAGRRGR
ncbi:MAG: phytanoyl-CoA dioxygenase family protein [Planctomycetes bacterium]|nr:phytanoyl-CoA dioxygenase family protein [Planctomycetota bacterium]